MFKQVPVGTGKGITMRQQVIEKPKEPEPIQSQQQQQQQQQQPSNASSLNKSSPNTNVKKPIVKKKVR